jgi:hypothetical protein
MSPDVDHTWAWVRIRQALKSKAMNHRELAHWWGLPGLAMGAVSMLPEDGRWPFVMLIVGWTSHLLGDLLFGIKPRGVPLWPCGPRVGLGLDTGGFLETGTIRVGGLQRKVLSFGPARVLIALATVLVLMWPLWEQTTRPPPPEGDGGPVQRSANALG